MKHVSMDIEKGRYEAVDTRAKFYRAALAQKEAKHKIIMLTRICLIFHVLRVMYDWYPCLLLSKTLLHNIFCLSSSMKLGPVP